MVIFVSAAALILLFPSENRASAPAALNEAAYAELPASATGAAAATTSANGVAVPILVYHVVRPSYPGDDAAVRAIALTPETFGKELAHLKSAGYHLISFHELEAHFQSNAPLPPKPIILSFDDGWRDQFVYAFPILKAHGDRATFFIFTNAIGRRGFMTWDDLRALVAAGMPIGAHSRSHPFLTKITDPAKLWNEIDGSKTLLEKTLGVSVTEFAYPFGQYNPAIVALVKKAGFLAARGDYWSGNRQTPERLYMLSALNAPTTTAAFEKLFP